MNILGAILMGLAGLVVTIVMTAIGLALWPVIIVMMIVTLVLVCFSSLFVKKDDDDE